MSKLKKKDRKKIKSHSVLMSQRYANVRTDPIDRALGKQMKLEVRGRQASVFSDMLADLHYYLYKHAPEIVLDKNAPPEYEATHDLIEMFAPFLKDVKRITTMDVITSLTSAKEVWQQVMELPPMQELLNDIGEADENRGASDSSLEGARLSVADGQTGDEDAPEKNPSEMSPEELQDELDRQTANAMNGENPKDGLPERQRAQAYLDTSQKQKKHADRAAERAKEKSEKMKGDALARGMMQKLAQDAMEKAGDAKSFLASWGPGNDDDPQSIDNLDEMMSIVNTNIGALSKLSRIVGRLKGVAISSIEATINSHVGPPVGVGLTRDLTRTFPTERFKLSKKAPPLIRATQIGNWASHGLIGWVPRSEGLFEGSFVAYVDTSSSMTHYQILDSAKAVAYAMAVAFNKNEYEKRPFVLRNFGSNRQFSLARTTDRSSVKQVVEWAKENYNGGTGFETPFQNSIEDIEYLVHKRGVKGVDFVFITDGEAPFEEGDVKRWRKSVERYGTRLIFIKLGDFAEATVLTESADLFVHLEVDELLNNPERFVRNITKFVAQARYEKRRKP